MHPAIPLRQLALLLLSLLPHLLFSQAWSPLLPGHRYLFSTEGDKRVTDAVWVESETISGTDTVYTLNRVAKELFGSSDEYVIRQLGFLQADCRKMAAGVFRFEGQKAIRLESLAALNHSWLWDSTLNIQATVTQVDTLHRWGLIDSAKTISLSNGNTCILSKHWGLLKYEGYELVGIPTLGVGRNILQFSDFFADMDISKKYCFTAWLAEPGGCLGGYGQQTISQKKVKPDSIYILGWIDMKWYCNPSTEWIIVTHTYTSNPDELYNRAFPNHYEIVPNTNMGPASSVDAWADTSSAPWVVRIFRHDANSIRIIEYYLGPFDIPDTIAFDAGGGGVVQLRGETQYSVKKGMTSKGRYSWEFFRQIGLSSIQTGLCPGFAIPIDESVEGQAFTIQPNPFGQQISINTQLPVLRFRIVDQFGRQLWEGVNDYAGQTLEIRTSDWASGIYYLHTQTAQGGGEVAKLWRE